MLGLLVRLHSFLCIPGPQCCALLRSFAQRKCTRLNYFMVMYCYTFFLNTKLNIMDKNKAPSIPPTASVRSLLKKSVSKELEGVVKESFRGLCPRTLLLVAWQSGLVLDQTFSLHFKKSHSFSKLKLDRSVNDNFGFQWISIVLAMTFALTSYWNIVIKSFLALSFHPFCFGPI